MDDSLKPEKGEQKAKMALAPWHERHDEDDMAMKVSETLDTAETPPLIQTDSLSIEVQRQAPPMIETTELPERSRSGRSTRSSRSPKSPKSRSPTRRRYRDRSLTQFEVRMAMLRHHVGEILNSQRFDSFLGLIIISNAVNIGLDLTWRAEGRDTHICGMLEHVFLGVYVAELLMRLFVDWKRAMSDNWVRFDLFLVILGVLSQWILEPFFAEVSEVNTLILLRMARLLRLAKTVRYLMRFRELWLLVQGLANSAYTMIYTILLLVVILYIFACLILQLLYQHPMLQEDEDFARTVRENFSNLPSAMVTLLQFVSFDNIVHVYKPLGDKDPVLLAYFVVVILVVGIVIMNLVTAVIVNSSLEQAAKDKSLLQSIEEQNRKKVLAELRAMFFRLDYDNSGEVSREEIAAIAPREQQMLRELTGFDDALELFDALDLQETGEIGIEEFCQGLWQVALSDSPLEIKRMQKQVEHIKHHVAKYMAETDNMKSLLRELLNGMHRMESGVNSMSSVAWVPSGHSDNNHSFIAAPFGYSDYAMTRGPPPGWGGGMFDSNRETRRDGTESADSSSSAPSSPTPKKKRNSISAKATELARKLAPETWGRGSADSGQPDEAAPAWANELIRDVQSLRSITQNVVCRALSELQVRLPSARVAGGVSSNAGDHCSTFESTSSLKDPMLEELGAALPSVHAKGGRGSRRSRLSALKASACTTADDATSNSGRFGPDAREFARMIRRTNRPVEWRPSNTADLEEIDPGRHDGE
ncbi:CACNA1F [Symbiodinium natans]|uniref:CACNA1F protein n=1 Tax=Symbiodinium natans TaxID=878477 RepID=A0A812ID88_9DINO|nr:CACNA1F [Symbiodinium natans]